MQDRTYPIVLPGVSVVSAGSAAELEAVLSSAAVGATVVLVVRLSPGRRRGLEFKALHDIYNLQRPYTM